MKRKVKELLEDLVSRISHWETVDTITVAETAEEDLLSPYFFLSIDIFYRKNIPSPEERMNSFQEALVFESSYFGSKDRFLLDNIPVRLEYKNIERIETLLQRKEGVHFGNRESGTYIFYRVKNNQLLYQRSPWLSKVQNQIKELPNEFWIPLKEAYWSNLEHQLADLGTAVLAEDDYFFQQSLTGYLTSLCSLLFTLNREFEPSGRRIQHQLLKLDQLPENFRGRFASLIHEDLEFTPERKMEVAKLIARSLVPLV